MTGLLIIGDEILSGRRKDQHLGKAIELLQQRGMAVSWARYVGDEPDRITDELRQIRSQGEGPVFSFGGIGATPDDHTRGAAARAWAQPLVLHPQARALILERCRWLAQEEGLPFDEQAPDIQRRLQMGEFPQSAQIVPNPYNQIPGFSMDGRVHFLPGFPVMAWPMMAWVLDQCHAHLHGSVRRYERAIIVRQGIESRLTPLMLELEQRFAPVKVFSLPSVDHPVHGRHVELGVKGDQALVDAAFAAMMQALHESGADIGPEVVRAPA